MDTGSKKIARVFPRRTSATPHDELAFVGAITMETIAAIARAEPSEIHISATFTWDLPDVDELYESYSVFGVPVEVGGPAFGDRMGDFVPGMYIREGLVFTSRGCNKNCWFCSVPKCCNGEIRELPIVDGWNILDDNVLATSMEHFRGVCNMLMRQPEWANRIIVGRKLKDYRNARGRTEQEDRQ